MKPLTSLLLLLLWVYWQAANNFPAYTATRSPGVAEAPAASTEAFRVNRQNADTSSSPPLPCFLLCCHKLFSLRWCAGLMLIMLMPANTMAASKNVSEFYGAWFAIRPANQKLEPFPPQESTFSLAGIEKG